MNYQSVFKKPLLGVMITLMLSLGGGLTAADPGIQKGSLFDVYFAEDVISMDALYDFDWALLRITGPAGFVFEETYYYGEVPHFQTLDAEGNVLPNGQYTYELMVRSVNADANKAGMDQGRDGNTQPVTAVMNHEETSQTGYFRIADGLLLVPNFVEPSLAFNKDDDGRDGNTRPGTPKPNEGDTPPAQDRGTVDADDPSTRDQVITDDLVVDGSICVGDDCANGVAFGFDTLLLKENNLRIKFDDTSNSGSFPQNDWQLTANDSINGGANRFSIDDISGGRTPFTVEAGAPSNSLYVDDNGRVGIGTSTPVVELHVPDGDTPTLRLEQDQSSGFAAQTWDVAGNEANFFIRDVTNGSRLPFKIQPAAPSNSLYVKNNGDIGLGTASPGAKLDVTGSTGAGFKLRVIESAVNSGPPGNELVQFTNNGAVRMALENTADADEWIISNFQGLRLDYNAGTLEFRFREDGGLETLGSISVGAAPGTQLAPTNGLLVQGEARMKDNLYVTGQIIAAGAITANGVIPASDRNKKENINLIDSGAILEKVAELPISTWNFITDEDNVRHLGPMAQDFYALFGLGDRETGIYTVDSDGVALASIQALHKRLEARQTEITELKQENREMADKLSRLEAMVNSLLEQNKQD